MDFTHVLVLMSLGISFVGMSLYIRDMLRGTTKPNLISYAMWASAPLVGAAAALFAGADWWGTARIVMSGLVPAIVLCTALFLPQAYWKLSAFDFICGVFSLLALGVWLIAGSPTYAVLIAAIGDAAATFPTLRKAWFHPETETGMTYVLGFIAALIVFPAIPEFTIVNASFQIYLLSANCALLLVVYRKKIFKRFLTAEV